MVITEIFTNPTVKQVIFEIKFPNLFYIESKVGELQLKILDQFPESSLLFRKQFFFVDKMPKGKIEDVLQAEEETGNKVWEFRSKKNYRFSLTSNSLAIISEFHKTYNLGTSDRFRDTIKFVTDKFFEVITIPILTRIGLRYIDECPIKSKDNETFKSYYNSVLPVDRFNIADTVEMTFRTVTKKIDVNLIYMEELKQVEDKYKLILSFDGFATDVRYEDCMAVTDKLHAVITEEYEKSIKEPVYKYMRGQES